MYARSSAVVPMRYTIVFCPSTSGSLASCSGLGVSVFFTTATRLGPRTRGSDGGGGSGCAGDGGARVGEAEWSARPGGGLPPLTRPNGHSQAEYEAEPDACRQQPGQDKR